ncbi:hypothetical protein [Treponema phagedenis]|uniref:Transglutaminase-like domain-containing protein n=1 Tax=Treponema phagedenis TaxID=162 RepID=A0AAE6IUL7_TREPH|nr:hypothetical protein [Treponema phagedenis]QEJ98231.1 hypothetical protein FUT82_09630 [Treponema phagedenis]QEK03741.1 hypothetical protein FUT83_07940 [Treponema phagedenis]QEK09356.1 hypothetical protein FUT81_07855 [Treponema phagedenis]
MKLKKNLKIISVAAVFFITATVSLFADFMTSPTWGYALDLPEGFRLVQKEGNSRYLFQSEILPVDVQIALYPQTQFKTIDEAAQHIFTQLSAKKQITSFIWRDKPALNATLSFTADNKQMTGRLLTLQLADEKGWLVLLSYCEKEAEKRCEPLMLSALDAVFTDGASFFTPGPITTAAYPKKGLEKKTVSFHESKISVLFDKNDGQANQAVVDREFSILTLYRQNPEKVQAAWQRYYRMIYRDAWDRLAQFSFAIGTALPKEAKKDARKTAARILTWLQGFQYKRNPAGSDFINIPDAAIEKKGDCDVRGVLMAVVLQQMGIDTILMVSPQKSHALAAVDCKGEGARFQYNKKQYLIAETTASVEIGKIAADLADPALWFGVDFHTPQPNAE